jgi:hypothetical protein
MIRAVYRDGAIRPVDDVPVGWQEGDKLIVDQEETTPTPEEIDAWVADVEAATSQILDEDHDRAMAAIAQHRSESKRQARRELGLPE